MCRRVITARDQYEMVAPWRESAAPDLCQNCGAPKGRHGYGHQFGSCPPDESGQKPGTRWAPPSDYGSGYRYREADYDSSKTTDFLLDPLASGAYGQHEDLRLRDFGPVDRSYQGHPEYNPHDADDQYFLHDRQFDPYSPPTNFHLNHVAAAHPDAHPDLHESFRTHGSVHTTGGRVLPAWRLAVAPQHVQEQRLADPVGWQRHIAVPPNPMAVQGARAYTSKVGLPDPHQIDYSQIRQNPQTVRTVGRHYDSLPNFDPAAAPHYAAMAKEVGHQFDHMTKGMGIQVHATDEDPYSDVHEMMDDVANNKRLKVLGTHATGGHPFFSDADNDKFRAVHDFFGHAATGRSFDRHGEQAAYLAHAQMFSPQAHAALASETKGQNTSLILNGHFGPQKIAAMHPQHWANDLSNIGIGSTRAAS